MLMALRGHARPPGDFLTAPLAITRLERCIGIIASLDRLLTTIEKHRKRLFLATLVALHLTPVSERASK